MDSASIKRAAISLNIWEFDYLASEKRHKKTHKFIYDKKL